MDIKIYPFGLANYGKTVFEDEQHAKNILGGKGAGLHWMTQKGINVPPGFVIPTEVWAAYDVFPKATMIYVEKTIKPYIADLENHFGFMPLVSVRSGARVSCPGMMDTILNVGLYGTNLNDWCVRVGESCTRDSYTRLIQMYASTVYDVDKALFMSGTEYQGIQECLEIYHKHVGSSFPNPEQQILGSIEAVFKSWNSERAKIYRKMHGYSDSWGTAVTVQAMVFGNLNNNSGSGVLFTRNPDTGENTITGEFLTNAQGEDVVAGIRTPMPLSKMAAWNKIASDELLQIVTNLEKAKRNVQDVEFTIQDGKVYLLQTRDAKRTPRAALKIALDMHNEGILTAAEAVARVTPREFDLSTVPVIDPKFKHSLMAQGLPACSGIVSGVPVFSSKDAIKYKVPCILITEETTPDDIAGMNAAVGVITMNGGVTSHAAVVARGMNKPCITGVGKSTDFFKSHAQISMDGASGKIWSGIVPTLKGDTALAMSYTLLVHKVHGTAPIIFGKPAVKLPVALLYLGGSILDKGKSWETIKTTASMCDKLIIDLSMETSTFAEQVFYDLFESGLSKVKEELIVNLEQALFSGSEIVIIGGKSKKFKTIATTSDLESVVMASGGIVISGKITPVMEKVLKWKKSEGVDAIYIGELNPDGKSYVAFEKLLQTSNK